MPPLDITPEEYERQVEAHLRASGAGLLEFLVTHREQLPGVDGVFQIDAVARFEALGAAFVVLVECKLTKRPVEREDVQVLVDRIGSTGAHKGMMFSTAGFQSGALDYARVHGVATIQFADGSSSWGTKSYGAPKTRPPWADAYAAWIVTPTAGGGEQHTIMKSQPEALLQAFEPQTE